MPSSDECIEASIQLKEWAKNSLVQKGWPEHYAAVCVALMSREERIEEAEKYLGRKIYTGPYSPY